MNTMFWPCLLSTVLFSLSLGNALSQSFQPQISAGCAEPLASLVEKLSPNGCGPTLSDVLTSSSMVTTCTTGTKGVDCYNPGAVFNAAQAAKDIVPVYRLPSSSGCTLCTDSNGMIEGCNDLLTAAVGAAFGNAPDYSSFGITNATTIAQCNQLVAEADASCFVTDRTSVQILQYQSDLLCDSTNTFGMTISSAGNIQGVVDMRAVMQCGTCAVVPCLPGQLCNGDGKATMCPEGYYCPTPATSFKCPSGYFCPQGSTAPTRCRSIAAGSCNEGVAREVVWIPLFIALILLILIYMIEPMYTLLTTSKEGSVADHYSFHKLPVSEKMSFSTHSSLVSIEFNHLQLVTGKTVRIQDVSGTIRPGKFTAIIGGSGAGKTSLMNVILGREAATAGTIDFYSDDYAGKIPAKLLDRIIAFVPQNDIYLREMTVYELIEHSARWRLPTFLSEAKIHERIEEVLTQLQLQHLRDVTVGGFGQSYGGKQTTITLSPGDRKKVNIALELVAGPNILFLDEPTTGIDSSSALKVATIVSNLAKTGLTCVAVIHQPRTEIFSLIDDMIILQRGGRVAYQGPTKYVMQYFALHGFHTTNPKANKTDFLIDITSKPPPKEVLSLREQDMNRPATQAVAIQATSVVSNHTNDPTEGEMIGGDDDQNTVQVTWADLWEKEGKTFLEKMEKEEEEGPAFNEMETNNHNQGTLHNEATVDPSSTKTFVPLDVQRRGFFTQFYLSTRRGLLQHFKNHIYLNDLCIYFIAGIIMGIVTCGGPLYVPAIPYIYNGSCPPGAEIRCNAWIRFEIGPATFLITMILGAVTIPGAVRTFGREKEVFRREADVGANKLAYFIGKVMADLPFLVINTFMFMAPMIAIAPWQSPADQMYAVMLCISFVVLSMGYWLSFLFQDPDAAVLTGVILAILLNLFSGFVPTIGDGPIGWFMYTHYSARAITVTELQDGQGVSSTEDFNTVVPDPWKNPNLGNDVAGMIVIALILLIVTFLTLLYRNRRVGKI